MTAGPSCVRRFGALRMEDAPWVGGKTASVGELYATLTDAGLRVPKNFALTAEAFRAALTEADDWTELHNLLDGLYHRDVVALADRAAQSREIRDVAFVRAPAER